MWAVLTVPDQPPTNVGFEVPAGTDLIYFKLLLDTYLRERKYGPGRSGFGCKKVLEHITGIRAPQRQSSTDPLLWDLRVRWSLRKATLALPYLQHDIQLPEELLPDYPTIPSNTFTELAARFCGSSAMFFGDNSICLEVRDRLRKGTYPASTHADYQTCYWLLWNSVIRGESREETFDIIWNSGILRRRPPPLPTGQLDETDLREIIRQTRWSYSEANPVEQTLRDLDHRGFDPERPTTFSET